MLFSLHAEPSSDGLVDLELLIYVLESYESATADTEIYVLDNKGRTVTF